MHSIRKTKTCVISVKPIKPDGCLRKSVSMFYFSKRSHWMVSIIVLKIKTHFLIIASCQCLVSLPSVAEATIQFVHKQCKQKSNIKPSCNWYHRLSLYRMILFLLWSHLLLLSIPFDLPFPEIKLWLTKTTTDRFI